MVLKNYPAGVRDPSSLIKLYKFVTGVSLRVNQETWVLIPSEEVCINLRLFMNLHLLREPVSNSPSQNL